MGFDWTRLPLRERLIACQIPLRFVLNEARRLKAIPGAHRLLSAAETIERTLYPPVEGGAIHYPWPWCPECKKPVNKVTYIHNPLHGSIHRLIQCHGTVLKDSQIRLEGDLE